MDNHHSEVNAKLLAVTTSGNHVNTSMATIEKMCAANATFHYLRCLLQTVCGKHLF